jgi:hypothetical protein
MSGLAVGAVILDREQAMRGRTCHGRGIGILVAAVGTRAAVASGWSLHPQDSSARPTSSRLLEVGNFIQFPASSAHQNVERVTLVFGKETPRK